MSIAIIGAYLIGVAGIVWFALDSGRIPSMIWYWSGFSRLGWWGAILMCLVPFGVPALIVAVVWRFSEARRVLTLDEGRGWRSSCRPVRSRRPPAPAAGLRGGRSRR